MSKKRRYDEGYIQFGFSFITERDGTQKPQCFLCGKILCNDNMKPARLREHLEKVHPSNSKDSIDVFKQKRARFLAAGTLPKLGFSSSQKPALEASFKVAYLIAKNKKPHTIGETLVKPCALEMVKLMCGHQQMKQVKQVPLSNDTIHSRIGDMAADILEQVVSEMRSSPFPVSMQLDESTDVAQCSQLLVFVRYVHSGLLKEEFLFCKPLLATTKAADVLQLVREFFAENHFDWTSRISSICTDGAPSMLGNKSGFSALVKEEVPDIVTTHCILHRQALACKTLPPTLKSVLSTAVQVVNFIRSRALNHRLFKLFCQEVGSEHEVLLYHTEVRWLSRGRILSRLVELRVELAIFLREKESDLADKLDCPHFIHYLAYLADIFSILNELNTSLQGPAVTVMDATEKLQAFLNKLPLFQRRLEKSNFANFPLLDEVVVAAAAEGRAEGTLPDNIKEEISEHLSTLQRSFDGYFCQEIARKDLWIRNPFLCELDNIDDSDLAKDDLIDLRTREILRSVFNCNTLIEFWSAQLDSYPRLAKRAVLALIPFATTYLCEAGFSTLLTIKSKARNKLNAEDDMRVALSKTVPRFQSLIDCKQQQISH